MDAGKINSLIQSLRPGDSGGRAREGDAAFAAKIAAAALLDDVMKTGESEPLAGAGAPPQAPLTPRTGVVVNLSTGVVAAEMASRMGIAVPRPADSVHPRPDTVAAAVPAHVYSLTERLADPLRTNVVTSGSASPGAAEERRTLNGGAPAFAISQSETRADVLPFPMIASAVQPRIDAVEQRSSAATAFEQARASEHLAGLNAKAPTQVPARWGRFDRVILAAIALALLVVLFL